MLNLGGKFVHVPILLHFSLVAAFHTQISTLGLQAQCFFHFSNFLLNFTGKAELSIGTIWPIVISKNISSNKILHRKLIDVCIVDYECDDDGNSLVRAVLGTCLNLIADLTKDCIKGIHLVENKRSDLRKLLQLKLSFSLEQTMSLAKLACQFKCPGETKSRSPFSFTVLKYCNKYVQTVLSDLNLQVSWSTCVSQGFVLGTWSLIIYQPLKDIWINFTGSSNWIASSQNHITEVHRQGRHYFPHILLWRACYRYFNHFTDNVEGFLF